MTEVENAGSYQDRVATWLCHCFGEAIALDASERTHRFLEEALELAQAGGCSRADAALLLDYVFSRPVGEIDNEVGGVMVTLAGLCQARGLDMTEAAEQELIRNRNRTAEIRTKRAKKKRSLSPLPR